MAEPGNGFRVILQDAAARSVYPPEAELRVGVALLSGCAEPGNGFRVILQDAAALSVYPPEAELRVGVALFSGCAEPGDGFRVILWDAAARSVHLPEAELRVGVALLSGFTIPSDSFDIILWHAATRSVHEPEEELRGAVASCGESAHVFDEARLCVLRPHRRTERREAEGGDRDGGAHGVANHAYGATKRPRLVGAVGCSLSEAVFCRGSTGLDKGSH